MKTKISLLSIFFGLFCSFLSIAQPFELDPKIKPIELALQPDSKTDGALGIATVSKVEENISYYFVTGHDVFQPIDIYIFSITTEENFTVELVKDSWNDLIETKNSSSSKNGIINFKLRAWGAFGFKISPLSKAVQYIILIKAGAPLKEYLGSPFVEATKANTGIDNKENTNTKNDNSPSNNDKGDDTNSNIFMYIIIGLLLVVIGLLAVKFLGKGKTASVLLLFLLYNFTSSFASMSDETTMTLEEARMGEMERTIIKIYNDYDNKGVIDLAVEKALEKLKESIDGLDEVIKMGKAAVDFAKSHKGLSDCINSTPLPGAPRIPSFCTTEHCSSCFGSAREKFNYTRYQFEKLSAIYKCTIEYSKKAIALGDNTSGIHAVSGMAWQIQRTAITKSVDDLKKAYDNRYDILLNELQDSMQKLSNCEAEHGLEDWFDRFGYIYYEFIKDKYKRDV